MYFYGSNYTYGSSLEVSYIQIQEGSIATPYEPYGKYKLDVVNRGVNLLPFPFSNPLYPSLGLDKPITKNGVTFTPNSDGSITIDGTSEDGTTIYLYNNKSSLIPGIKVGGDSITISKNPDDLSQHVNVYFVCNYYNSEGAMKSGAQTSNTNTHTKVITEDWVGIAAYIHVPNGKTLNNLTIKPQIQIGLVATDYEPYRPLISTPIYLDEPLRGIGDYKDKIDFESQTIERKIWQESLSEYAWKENGSGSTKFYYTNTLPIKPISPSGTSSVNQLSNFLNISNGIGGTTTVTGVSCFSSGIVRARPDLTIYDTLEKWQEYMGSNECYVMYAIEPITKQFTFPELPLLEGTNILSIDGDI
jgi:hypothetical protein